MVQQSPEVAWANVVYFYQTGFQWSINWSIGIAHIIDYFTNNDVTSEC